MESGGGSGVLDKAEAAVLALEKSRGSAAAVTTSCLLMEAALLHRSGLDNTTSRLDSGESSIALFTKYSLEEQQLE